MNETTSPSTTDVQVQHNSATSSGEAITWLVGGSLALCLFMVVGFLSLIAYYGLAAFWPQPIQLAISENPSLLVIGEFQGVSGTDALFRTSVDRTGQSFHWVSDWETTRQNRRLFRSLCRVTRKNGPALFGFRCPDLWHTKPNEGTTKDQGTTEDQGAFADQVEFAVSEQNEVFRLSLEEVQYFLGSLPRESSLQSLLKSHAALKQVLPAAGPDTPVKIATVDEDAGYAVQLLFLDSPEKSRQAFLLLADKTGAYLLASELRIATLSRDEIRRITQPNQLGLLGSLSLYLDRWARFLFSTSNTADPTAGILSSLLGTTLLTLAMLVIVIPLGLTAALYLHEYTQGGWMVSLIRASVTNLAGVPSIVFGVFGLSFFCYTVGAFIDGGPDNAQLSTLPQGIWLGSMILLLLGSISGFCMFLFFNMRSQQKPNFSRFSLFLWLFCTGMMAILLFRCPLFEGFFPSQLPNPTFGKGGLIWSALTLSMLTLPTMIVTCEEAFSQVPRTLRNGSLACGATKWQTILRVVIPFARRGIATGAILCMARGTAAVAPLILVGALPYVRDWPIDGQFPFLHGSRGFMHLGHQIYILGFESQDAEAARPLAFACSLLLVSMIAVLNAGANLMRSEMRKNPVS